MKHLKAYFEIDKYYKINLLLSAITLFFVIWFSSGTLSPYALSAPEDLIKRQYTTYNRDTNFNDMVLPGFREISECRYIGNLDHGQFHQPLLMIEGQDKKLWEGSVYLRRILYPVLIYPFYKVMGFETGGAVANFFIHFITFFIFATFMRREIGREAAIFATWSIATFPGIAYFGGLPYSHALIVPSCLISVILLWKLEKITEIKPVFVLSLGLGVIFLGYDFLPIFGFAAIYIMLRRKMFWGAIISIAGLLLPSIIFGIILKYYYGAQLTNSNTDTYQIIAFSYLGVFNGCFSSLGIDPNSSIGVFLQQNSPFPDLVRWWNYLKYFPVYLIFNYVFSTFAYLSVAFALINIPKAFGRRLKLNYVESGVLLAVFLLFAFSNLAPPFRGWQFRDYGFARVYEPMFIVLILYIARKIQTLPELSVLKRRIIIGLALFVIIGNLVTSFSTMLPNNWGLGIYGNFYLQADTTKKTYSDFKERIRKYGRYPIGFCGPIKNVDSTEKK